MAGPPSFDCQACGACCREGYDTVEIDEDEPLVTARPELVARGPFGRLNLKRDGPRCACLAVDGAAFACRIYRERPTPCRDLEAGSEACLTARRRVGLPTR